MKVAINNCYGGFHLSPLAESEIAKRKGLEIKFTTGFGADTRELTLQEAIESNSLFTFSDLKEPERNDADLIAVVEELGGKANSSVSNIKIIEIPDDVEWGIEEYDGREWVAEKHRTWGDE